MYGTFREALDSVEKLLTTVVAVDQLDFSTRWINQQSLSDRERRETICKNSVEDLESLAERVRVDLDPIETHFPSDIVEHGGTGGAGYVRMLVRIAQRQARELSHFVMHKHPVLLSRGIDHEGFYERIRGDFHRAERTFHETETTPPMPDPVAQNSGHASTQKVTGGRKPKWDYAVKFVDEYKRGNSGATDNDALKEYKGKFHQRKCPTETELRDARSYRKNKN